MKMLVRQKALIEVLAERMHERDPLIQVILGPRQVGKTTAALALQRKLVATHYASADNVISSGQEWLFSQWELALRKQSSSTGRSVLIIDEVQKIARWSEILKGLWDEGKRSKRRPGVILLGSSSLSLHEGLSESLTGRFELHRLYQWTWHESLSIRKMNLSQYLKFGGYPGSYRLIANTKRWSSYIRDSVVNTVIDRDILTSMRVKSPALFRQSFELFISFPAQEISYAKLLGQLQDRGNIDLVKHYLNLFEQAFLLKSIHKYSGKRLVMKSSSPKIVPMCPALSQIDQIEIAAGRLFEASVGADLLKITDRVFYWRDGNDEIDYVVETKKGLFAIEVKSGRKRLGKGFQAFVRHFPHAAFRLVDSDSYLDFSADPIGFLET